MKPIIQILIVVSLIVSVGLPASAQNTISQTIQNEFIKIVVNNSDQDNGHFSIETTGGDPANSRDDTQSLIYGRPIPWTSYTTLKINDSDYIFGGPSIKLTKRTNQELKFGKFVSQTHTQDSITTTVDFGKIRVTQLLSFFLNPTTKVKDTCRIDYTVSNLATESAQVGLRLMIDTKLGSNDAAPFRIGSKEVNSELKMSRSDMVPFWQAFDSLSSPNIVAQGILESAEDRLTPPDTIIFANWGGLADAPWDFKYMEGRSFVRAGEEDNDTALAMYWNTRTLQPNQSIQYSTAYGLGGITMSAGPISLGLTAPGEITAGSPRDQFVVAYITNSSGFDAHNTLATLSLPPGLAITNRDNQIKIPILRAGETRQIPFKVTARNASAGLKSIELKVTSSTLAPNSIRREIMVNAPKSVTSYVQLPDAINDGSRYVTASVIVKNPHDISIESVEVTLPSTSLPWFEIPSKVIPVLQPGRTCTLNWVLGPISAMAKTVSISIQSLGVSPKIIGVRVPTIDSHQPLIAVTSTTNYQPGTFGFIKLSGAPGASYNYDVSVTGSAIQMVRYTPDQWMHEIPNPIRQDTPTLLTVGPLTIPSQFSGSILRWHFKAVQPGTSLITIKSNDFETSVPIVVSPSQIKE